MTRTAFAECLEAGQKGEEVLDNHFRQHYHIRPATAEEQKRGIDRVFTHKSKGYQLLIEYKTDDRAHSTGNAALETAKNINPYKQGWAVTCSADFIAYYVPGFQRIYMIQPEAIRINIGAWLIAYPLRIVKSEGKYQTYQTEVLLLPLAELEKVAARVVELES